MDKPKSGKFQTMLYLPPSDTKRESGLTSINNLLSFYIEPLGLFDLVLDVQDGFRFRGFDVEYL